MLGFSLYFCRVLTLKLKAHWGNCCSDFELYKIIKYILIELKWTEILFSSLVALVVLIMHIMEVQSYLF